MVHSPSGEIILDKTKVTEVENDVESLFKFLEKLPRINWKKAWKEVLEDRKREHR